MNPFVPVVPRGVDLFTYEPAPRRAVGEASKRRPMSLVALNISLDDRGKLKRRVAPVPPLPDPTALEGTAGGPSGMGEGEGVSIGPPPDTTASTPQGSPAGPPPDLLRCLQIPPALAAVDLVRQLHLPPATTKELTTPQRHYIAVHPAGGVVNFRLNPGGATSWMKVLQGTMV